MTHIHYLLARKAWRHFCWALYVVSHLNDEIFCYCINWRELREFLYLKYADTFGSRRTSSSVFGSPRKCWNNRELLENGQKLYGLFGFHFVSFWKIIYCHIFIQTLLLLNWWQNYIKTLSSVVDPPTQWVQVRQNSQVSFQMSEQYRLCAPSLLPPTDKINPSFIFDLLWRY